MKFSADAGRVYFTPVGITRACALSPLISAGLVYDVDTAMSALETKGVQYTRYKDDMLILAPTRWVMQQARRTLLTRLEDRGFTLHPDKTQVGRLPPGLAALPGEATRQGGSAQGTGRSASEIQHQLAQYDRRWTWFRMGMSETSGGIRASWSGRVSDT